MSWSKWSVKAESRSSHTIERMSISEMEEYDKAAGQYSKLLQENPTDHLALNNRAYMFAMMEENLPQAMADIDLAIQSEADNAAYVDTYGYLLYLDGKVEQSLEYFDRAIDLESNTNLTEAGMGELYFHRALAYEYLDRKSQARNDFNKAASLGYSQSRKPQPLFFSSRKPESK